MGGGIKQLLGCQKLTLCAKFSYNSTKKSLYCCIVSKKLGFESINGHFCPFYHFLAFLALIGTFSVILALLNYIRALVAPKTGQLWAAATFERGKIFAKFKKRLRDNFKQLV